MRLLIVVVTAVALQSCSRSTSAPPTREVRIAVSRDAITWLPLRLAQQLGYCQQEGLTLTVSEVAGLSKAAEALLGGSVDVAGGSLMLTIQLAAEGRSVRTFLTLYTATSWALVVAPAASGVIRTFAGLKGHRVGVSSPVAAVEHGQVDAAALVGSAITTLEPRHPNLRLLADARTPERSIEVFGASVSTAALVAPERWLQANPDTARRLVRAVKRAMQWMREQSAERIRAEISDADRMPDTDADLDAIRYAQRAMSRDGILPSDAPEAVRKILALSNENVRTAQIDLSSTYTNEFALAK